MTNCRSCSLQPVCLPSHSYLSIRLLACLPVCCGQCCQHLLECNCSNYRLSTMFTYRFAQLSICSLSSFKRNILLQWIFKQKSISIRAIFSKWIFSKRTNRNNELHAWVKRQATSNVQDTRVSASESVPVSLSVSVAVSIAVTASARRLAALLISNAKHRHTTCGICRQKCQLWQQRRRSSQLAARNIQIRANTCAQITNWAAHGNMVTNVQLQLPTEERFEKVQN